VPKFNMKQDWCVCSNLCAGCIIFVWKVN